MTLLIRTFEDEDASGVVRLYNSCFQSYRTLDEWKWMYLGMPDFDKSGIVVAEDLDSREIIASLVVCRHRVSINGREHIVAMIDDVDTSRKWRGKGIATKLMKMVIEDYKERDCSALFLYANPFGEAVRIYRRLGFKDAKNFYYNGKMVGVRLALRNLPFPMNLASPLALLFSGVNIGRTRTKKAEVKVKRLDCTNNNEFRSYLRAMNDSLQRMPLFYPYSRERLTWMICQSPMSISPVARFIEQSGRILCGANSSIYKMRLFGRIFNSWVIGDIFTAPDLQGPKKESYIRCLIEKVIQDGQERGCALQMAPLSQHDEEMSRILGSSGLFRFIPTTFMCLRLDRDFLLPSSSIPWYFWKQHLIGVP